MRSIDISGLKGLGKEGAGPWRLGEDRLLRTASGGRPLRSPEEALAQVRVYDAARESGAGTPAAYEAVRLEGVAVGAPSGSGERRGGGESPGDRGPQDAAYGVVVEYVEGVALPIHVLVGSLGIEEAGFEIGRLQRRLHLAHMGAGRDWNAEFTLRARSLEPHLPPDTGQRIAALVEAMPACDTLLHGDLHLSNVVLRNGEFVPIDMEFAGFGNSAFDLAISRNRSFQNVLRLAESVGVPADEVPVLGRKLWESQLRGYMGDPSPAELSEADRRLAVLAEVEQRGADCVSDRAAASAPPAGIDEGIAVFAGILPRIDRLDLADLVS